MGITIHISDLTDPIRFVDDFRNNLCPLLKSEIPDANNLYFDLDPEANWGSKGQRYIDITPNRVKSGDKRKAEIEILPWRLNLQGEIDLGLRLTFKDGPDLVGCYQPFGNILSQIAKVIQAYYDEIALGDRVKGISPPKNDKRINPEDEVENEPPEGVSQKSIAKRHERTLADANEEELIELVETLKDSARNIVGQSFADVFKVFEPIIRKKNTLTQGEIREIEKAYNCKWDDMPLDEAIRVIHRLRPDNPLYDGLLSLLENLATEAKAKMIIDGESIYSIEEGEVKLNENVPSDRAKPTPKGKPGHWFQDEKGKWMQK